MELVLGVLSIALIDLVLSGDNAAVIGLAIKNLPLEQRKSAAFIGAGGAIVLRVLFTALATLLIAVPYLNAIGGALLLWITWKLLNSDGEEESVKSCNRYWAAIGSIVIADLSMAFDNIMGVAGAANGHIGLVIFGLALSIPILVIGSNWLATLMNRYSIIIYIGGAVLAHTALTMIMHDKALNLGHVLGSLTANILIWGITLAVFGYGLVKTQVLAGPRQEPAVAKEEK
jgi:YjbE family integral membrane protein